MRSAATGPLIRFDPRDFILPPFVACPKCALAAYGILNIHDHEYHRRCRECWFTGKVDLPPIRKTLIYLDQFAVSNLMFANPPAHSEVNKTVDQFWHQLFRNIKSLLHLQVAVCPASSAHDRESILSRHNKSLSGTIEALSLGVAYFDFETIKNFQLCDHLRSWLGGQASAGSANIENRILDSDPHVWTDRFLISLELGDRPEYLEAVKAEREAVSSSLNAVFQYWKKNPGVTWEKWFEEEALDFGPSIWKTYRRDTEQFAQVRDGSRPFSQDFVFPTQSQLVIQQLIREIEEAGIAKEQMWPKLHEFLHSTILQEVPFNKIAAALYASVAKKAPHQNKLPTTGFSIDVDVISCLLPYCDAMFLDVECWNYLLELKRSGHLTYDTRVFSMRNKDEFIEYLNGLSAAVSPEHRRLVGEVYGS